MAPIGSPWHSLSDLLAATDGHLSSRGEEQAERTAERLSSLPIEQVFTSSLIRCQDTAQRIAAKLGLGEPQKTDLLWECLPTMPPSPSEEVASLSHDEILASRDRADRVFAWLSESGTRCSGAQVVVTHGNLIRYLVTRALSIDIEKWHMLDTQNCSITELSFDSAGVRLVSLNESGHLPIDLHTYDHLIE
jgi:serine/threonine-protein phosphatase PGAM5